MNPGSIDFKLIYNRTLTDVERNDLGYLAETDLSAPYVVEKPFVSTYTMLVEFNPFTGELIAMLSALVSADPHGVLNTEILDGKVYITIKGTKDTIDKAIAERAQHESPDAVHFKGGHLVKAKNVAETLPDTVKPETFGVLGKRQLDL